MRRMPGRPSRRDDDTQDDARRAGGVIPAGALAMLLAISGVFVYGMYLKAAGPGESAVDAPARPASPAPAPPAGARPSQEARPAAPDAGLPTQTAMGYGDEPLKSDREMPPEPPPVIPEATTAGTLGTPSLGGGTASSAPRSLVAPSPPPPAQSASPAPGPAPGPAPSAMGSSSSASSSPSARTTSAARPAATSPRTSTPAPRPSASGVKARHDEPPPPASRETGTDAPGSLEPSPATGSAPAPTGSDERASRIAAAPRGAAPAVALRKANEQFRAKRYKEAASSWNDWALRAPAGSWTVQIAAIRLDKPASAGKLDGVTGRDGVFLLPSGTLPGGLSPVCVGVYPSEDAARRAAASMAPFPGSSNRPIPKPLSSLSR